MVTLGTLRKSFKGDIVTPGDDGYEEAITRWAKNAKRRAAVVAFVKQPEDVSLALKYAKVAKLPVAIRSGGHSVNGASSSDGGVVIDLSKYMRDVRVDPEKRIAYVQGGALWADVDQAGIEHGLATVGGTVNSTGVGGLITGGGYGWLSGQYGLAIDNLVQATVVVANGDILTASESQNADLFFGTRGGGSNFGVVTEFVLKLHPQRRTVFAGPLVFTRDKLEGLAKVLDRWFADVGEKEASHIALSRLPDTTPAILAFLFYNGSVEEGKKNYKALYDLGPLADMAQELPFETLNTLFNQGSPPGRCYWIRGVLSKNPLEILTLENFDNVMRYGEDYPAISVAVAVEYVPHGKINSVPVNATPYRRNLPGNALCLTSWDEETPENLALGMKIVTELSELAKAPGMEYGNYSADTEVLPVINGPVKPNRAKELFQQHYSKLQQVKRKYDPDMVFNKWFVVEPAAA